MVKSAQSSTKTSKKVSQPTMEAPRHARGKSLTMEELLASTGYHIPSLRRGQEVKGKIVAVSHSEILIDVGGKSEGIVMGRELAATRDLLATLAVGDSIDATVVYPENDAGQVVLSLRKLSGERRWSELEEKRANSEDVEVVAQEVNRGGVICDYFGLRGFLPSSQLSLPSSPPLSGQAGQANVAGKPEDLIGKTITVRVIEVDQNTNRLIFSQKMPGKADLEKLLKLLSKVKIGEKYEGMVTAILPFGVFVEIEVRESESQRVRESKSKLEGLVHISEISWEKVEDPATMFKVGDKAEVMVIAKDEATGRLNLSIKQLIPDPFEKASAKYTKDQAVTGTVDRVTPYGVFVTLEDPSGELGTSGMEGLMHISKIPPNENFDVGDEIECTIESVDTQARKISLVPVVKEKPILYR